MAKSSSEALWDEISARREHGELTERERTCWIAAEQNADDTSVEQSFEVFSQEWFRIFGRTYQAMLDVTPELEA